MINAAEPVNVANLREFYDVFAMYGLRRGVIKPTFGLAEHTLFVCSDGRTLLGLDRDAFSNDVIVIRYEEELSDPSRTAKEDPQIHTVVGCGLINTHTSISVRIAHPDTLELLGELEVC
jgi:hypothetical protein